MQTVYALPGIARRWFGLTTLIALATTVTLVRLTTISPVGFGTGGSYVAPPTFYMLHPHLGWNYFGFLMNGHGLPSFGGPQPSFGGGSPVAGLVAETEGRGQEDSDLTGAELASGRKPVDDTKVEGSNGSRDFTTSDSVLLDSSAPDTVASGSTRGSLADESADKRLLDLAELGRPAKYAATVFGDSAAPSPDTQAGRSLDGVPRLGGVWWQSNPHQFLSQAFPDAGFFRVAWGIPSTWTYAVAFKDGRSFPLDQIGDVLSAQGFSSDSSELNAMAKVAVLFAYCGRRAVARPDTVPAKGTARCAESRQPDDNRAFPAIEFRSFSRGTWRTPNGVDLPGVWVDCRIDGVTRAVFVQFRQRAVDRLLPFFVVSTDFGTYYFRSPAPAKSPDNRRGRVPPRDLIRGSLDVYSRWWEAQPRYPAQAIQHSFSCVEEDGNPVADSITFVLSGFYQNEPGVKLVFQRQQDNVQNVISVSINDSGCDTFVWHVTPDSNGEYVVWGQDGGNAGHFPYSLTP